ncbi:MAG: Smr/MutS family protein [Myxococcota bacterium]
MSARGRRPPREGGRTDEPGARGATPGPEAGPDSPKAGTERFADLVADARPLRKDPRAAPDAARRTPGAGPRKPATAPTPGDDAQAPAFRWPDPDDRHRAASPGVSDQQLVRLARGEPEPEERIDLHGTRVAEAKRLVARRIASARARGLRCVLVVHGRGRGSATNDAPLRDAVPDWLTRGETGRGVLAFAPAPRHQGGEGATLVLLRKPD